ncbi:DUF1828 domain-containing protein [Azospirillum brasilense]|uniref:DUF1828 domain-containing protein n=1 Tax=Azospirillum brasilense TaxID=192 RepID=UPI000E0AC522|nr:DUF1828 domain-containing protein [Azospirillum brasilense]
MVAESLKTALCRHFCADILIKETADGLAVSASGFGGDGGDRICFLIVDVGESHYLADDGDFLATLDASGMDIASGTRRQFIDGILRSAGAWWDSDTFVIRTDVREGPAVAGELIMFMTALVRVRDVRFWTRETVRSTFKEDVTAAIQTELSSVANINVGAPVDADLKEFPADVVLVPKGGGGRTAVYLVNTNDGLSEALALWQEARRLNRPDIKVMAIMEDEQNVALNKRKLQRTLNRIDNAAYFRGDEKAVIERLRITAGLQVLRA